MEKQRNEIKRVLQTAPLSIENPEWIDIFFHDILHTYSHIKKELMIIELKIKKNSNTLVDNIDTGDGEAFNKFLGCRNLVGYIHRDFGDAIIR